MELPFQYGVFCRWISTFKVGETKVPLATGIGWNFTPPQDATDRHYQDFCFIFFFSRDPKLNLHFIRHEAAS